MKKEMNIQGIHCQGCKMLIEDICSEYDEIISATVDVKSQKLVIEFAESFDINPLLDEIDAEDEFVVVR